MSRSRAITDSASPRPIAGAVAGLSAGLAAACVMNEFQRVYRYLRKQLAPQDSSGKSSSGKDSEPKPPPATVKAADKASELVTGHPLANGLRRHADTAVHYAFGASLGLAYGLTAEYWHGVKAGKGAAFGLGASLLTDETAVPLLNLSKPPWAYPLSSHFYGTLSHLIYGLTLETSRKRLRALAGGSGA